jgi:hypothetical protein
MEVDISRNEGLPLFPETTLLPPRLPLRVTLESAREIWLYLKKGDLVLLA